MNNSQSKTRGVLAAEEIEVIYARWHCGSAIGLARDIEAAVLAKAAAQSPVAPADESVCKGSFVLGTGCGKCSACLGEIKHHGMSDAPTVSATVPDGCILIQESDAVPFVHPEYGAGVFFTDDCKLNVAPTPPTSAPADAWMTDDGRVCNAASRDGMHKVTQASYFIPLFKGAPPTSAADIFSPYSYQKLFDAIAAATNAQDGGAVNVSVEKFRAAIAATKKESRDA